MVDGQDIGSSAGAAACAGTPARDRLPTHPDAPVRAATPRRHLACGKDFLDLQLRFALKVASLGVAPLDRAFLEHTNLYVRFGLGRAFDAAHPAWQDYLAGLHETDALLEWTHRFYVARRPAGLDAGTGPTFGCFSYELLPDGRVRLHFANADPDGSPLSAARAERRRAELAALFEHLDQAGHGSVGVVGRSWLYNLEAYRRLFPASYVATARVIRGGHRSMALWGQFLDRHGSVKDHVARPFVAGLEQTTAYTQLDGCFPLKALALDAPVAAFLDADRRRSGS